MYDRVMTSCEACKHRKDIYVPCDWLSKLKTVLPSGCPRFERDEKMGEYNFNQENMKSIEFDSTDRDGLVKLMNNNELYGHIILCINQNGESMHLSIQEDRIDAHVFQHNHWIRHMVYHRDGTVEEMYEGKWIT